jgi:hypothetical protein
MADCLLMGFFLGLLRLSELGFVISGWAVVLSIVGWSYCRFYLGVLYHLSFGMLVIRWRCGLLSSMLVGCSVGQPVDYWRTPSVP